MEEDSELYCSNCKRTIAAANFSTHSAFCQRNIAVCRVCNEPIPKSLFKEHEEEYHISVSCNFCDIPVQKWLLPKHQQVCRKRPVICEFCEGDFPFDSFDEHVEFCGSRTEKCILCSKFIMLKAKKEHSEKHKQVENMHRGYGEVEQNIKNEFISQINKKGFETKGKCSPVAAGDSEFGGSIGAAASISGDKSKQASREYTCCHLCRQSILWSKYEEHRTICGHKIVKVCFRCGELLPACDVEKHISSGCLKDTAMRHSRSKADECRPSPSSVYHDNESEEKRLATQVSSGDYFECDLCFEKILQADREHHLFYKCRVLQEKIQSDLYECPLCNEKLSEKDKSIHESFYCKALLDAKGGQLYSLAEERYKKDCKETKENYAVCPQCMSKVLKHDMASHKLSCNKNFKKQCTYCEKALYDHSEYHHLRTCEVYNKINQLQHNENGSDNKGAKPKPSNFSEMVKPKVGKCSFCKTVLNDNILLYHEKECVHQPITCQECFKTLPLKDIESHHCKPQKGKNGRKHQKIEKAENRSSWSILGIFGGNKSASKTLDQQHNDRNQIVDTRMENKYSDGIYTQVENDLYFAQPLVDDTKIPCEFCDAVFPASEIVLHMTGCNKEVSLPKSDSSESTKEVYPISQLREASDSATTSKNFFSNEKRAFSPSTKYESIHKRLGQRSETQPGEYLDHYSGKTSKMMYSDYQTNKNKNQSSSTFTAVWNNDVQDVEMEEIDPKTISSNLSPEMPVKESSKKCADIPEKPSSDSDEEVSSMLQTINSRENESRILKNHLFASDEHKMKSEFHASEDSSLYRSKIDTKIESKQHGHVKRYVSPISAGKLVNEPDVENYLSKMKADYHNLIKGFSSDDDDFVEANEPYSTELDAEFIISKSGSNQEEEKPFKNAFRHILNAEENFNTNILAKESTASAIFIHSKREDSKSDELDQVSRTDKFQSKKHVYKTDTESFDDLKKEQSAHNTIETEPALDRSKQLELANFRFGSDSIKRSFNGTEKLQNSETKQYDVYYKTNALGFVTVSDDEKSVIRKPRKEDPDIMCQSNILKTKHENWKDNIKRKNEKEISRTPDVSPLVPEKPFEVSRYRYHYQDDDVSHTIQKERFESKICNVSPSMPEVSKEKFHSKYVYQNDSVIEKSEKERLKSRTHDQSPSLLDKPFKMSQSRYKYCEEEDDSQASLKEKFESKSFNVSPSVTEVSSPEKSKYYTKCPMCGDSVKWIDYNTHVPACASAAGKCSRCGVKVSSSDLKEHFLKCTAMPGKMQSESDMSAEGYKSKIPSYEQVLNSLTLNKNTAERKSREPCVNTSMRTSGFASKMDCIKSSNSSNTGAKQAFNIEPVGKYWLSEPSYRKGISNYEESASEMQLKKTDKDSNRTSVEDIEKWSKWSGKRSDNS